MRRVALLVLVLLGAGCEDDDATLIVQLRTDLVPGAEFTGVVIRAEGVPDLEAIARRDMDFLEGVRVGEVAGLPRDPDVSVEVDLVTSLGVVVTRPLVVDLTSGNVAVTVLVTRDCRGVACPAGDDPTASACLAGRCVEPTCTEETPEDCGIVSECVRDDDCPALDMCSARICDDGICLYDEVVDACMADFFCNPETGCEPIPDFPDAGPRPTDAGIHDAGGGLDGGVDGGQPDAGPVCTIPGTGTTPFPTCTLGAVRSALVEGVIVAERNGCFVEGQLVGDPGVVDFVPATHSGTEGYLELMSDGRFRFIGGDFEGAIDVGITLSTTRFGASPECLRVHVVDPAGRTKRMVGVDGSLPSSWDPPGVPGATDSVWIPRGAHTSMTGQVTELFLESGATLTSSTPLRADLLIGTFDGDVQMVGGGILAGTVRGDLELLDGIFNLEGPLRVTGDLSSGGSTMVTVMSPMFRASIDGAVDTTGTDFGFEAPFPGAVLAIGGSAAIPRLVMPLDMGHLIFGGSSLVLGRDLPGPVGPPHRTWVTSSGTVTIDAPEVGDVVLGSGGRVAFQGPWRLNGQLESARPTDFASAPSACANIALSSGWSTATPGAYSGCTVCADDGLGQCASLGL